MTPFKPRPALAMPTLPLWVDHLIDACTNHEAGFHFEEGGCFAFAIALHGHLANIQPLAQIGVSKGLGHCVVMLGPVAVDHQGDLPFASTPKYIPLAGLNAVRAAALKAGHSGAEIDADIDWAENIIQTAKALCLSTHDGLQYPLLLPTSRAIADHIEATTPDGIDSEMVEEMFFDAQAVLVKVPTSSLIPDRDHADNHIVVPERDDHYKTLPAQTMPPIVLNDAGIIADGHHRHRAALARGDAWVLAYQVLDQSIDLGLNPLKYIKEAFKVDQESPTF